MLALSVVALAASAAGFASIVRHVRVGALSARHARGLF